MDNRKIEVIKMSEINLGDTFFDSLRADYAGFDIWFNKKQLEIDPETGKPRRAYVLYDDKKLLQGFLFAKEEKTQEDHGSIVPPLPVREKWLKLATVKINGCGDKVGERFIKKLFDGAMIRGYEAIYVTIYSAKQASLVDRLTQFGFVHHGKKVDEDVYVKYLGQDFVQHDVNKDYPQLVCTQATQYFLLSINPKWHTQLFADSNIQRDKEYENAKQKSNELPTHGNSISKIYLSLAATSATMKCGDGVVIYRTATDNQSAYYSSVITSLCTVVSVKPRSYFKTADELITHCKDRSVFSKKELTDEWENDKLQVVELLYNCAFSSPLVNREVLLAENLIPTDRSLACVRLEKAKFMKMLELTKINEHYIIHKT